MPYVSVSASAVQSHAATEDRLRALISASSEVLYSLTADWSTISALSRGNFLVDMTTSNPQWFPSTY